VFVPLSARCIASNSANKRLGEAPSAFLFGFCASVPVFFGFVATELVVSDHAVGCLPQAKRHER
jgi:hypothetical protein